MKILYSIIWLLGVVTFSSSAVLAQNVSSEFSGFFKISPPLEYVDRRYPSEPFRFDFAYIFQNESNRIRVYGKDTATSPRYQYFTDITFRVFDTFARSWIPFVDESEKKWLRGYNSTWFMAYRSNLEFVYSTVNMDHSHPYPGDTLRLKNLGRDKGLILEKFSSELRNGDFVDLLPAKQSHKLEPLAPVESNPMVQNVMLQFTNDSKWTFAWDSELGNPPLYDCRSQRRLVSKAEKVSRLLDSFDRGHKYVCSGFVWDRLGKDSLVVNPKSEGLVYSIDSCRLGNEVDIRQDLDKFSRKNQDCRIR